MQQKRDKAQNAMSLKSELQVNIMDPLGEPLCCLLKTVFISSALE